jgi:xanthine dehydrogenase large subunit
MMAISAREAIRDAIAAFGPGGAVPLDSPLTPERIFWALEKARKEHPVPAAASASGMVRA